MGTKGGGEGRNKLSPPFLGDFVSEAQHQHAHGISSKAQMRLLWAGLIITLTVTLIGWVSATLGWVSTAAGDKRQTAIEVSDAQTRLEKIETKQSAMETKQQSMEVTLAEVKTVVVWLKTDRQEEHLRNANKGNPP